jgi:hypothetical protein
MSHKDLPVEGRAAVEAVVSDALTRGSPGSKPVHNQVRELVDELTQATSDEQLETWLIAVDHHLRCLPEAERRARMYELVMWLGLIDPA